jgi:hypothetical protein
MTIREIVSAIELKHKEDGIVVNKPASTNQIKSFENKIGFDLPKDFKEFYLICNGFSCTEDIFNMMPLEEITRHKDDYGSDWFHFAEYMIYSDMWSLRKKVAGTYEIFNKSTTEVVLSNSLLEFLERFLQGGIFEKGGFYEWHDHFKQL